MECSGSECSTMQSCDCGPSNQCACGGQGCPGCNPNMNTVDFMTMIWNKAAMEAMFEVKKEKIKEKMLKNFGDVIDKGAEATVNAFSKKMFALMESSQSDQDLRAKLASIINEVKRK